MSNETGFGWNSTFRPVFYLVSIAAVVPTLTRRLRLPYSAGLVGFATMAALSLAISAPLQAESKEVIELQTQVQLLSDLLQRLQSTLDAHLGGLQKLMQQTTSGTDQTSQTIAAVEQDIGVQSSNLRGKLDINAGQLQSLRDSVNELKSHVDRLAQSIQSLQSQLQTLQNSRQAPSAGQVPVPGMIPEPTASLAPGGSSEGGTAPNRELTQAPPLQATFQAALSDYYAAKYGVAKGEFQDVIHYYPESDRAGTAQFYLGEIAYTAGDYAEAIKDYGLVIQQYSGNPKEPTAELHKGYALLQSDQREAGIEQLRSLIQRYPQGPEASDARRRLRSMGVSKSAYQP